MSRAKLDKVMYVEDEADIREVARLALESVGGFTVKLCRSGPEAVAAAPAFEPQLVLLDVMMPGMDGPDTMAALHALPGFETVPSFSSSCAPEVPSMVSVKAPSVSGPPGSILKREVA